MLVTARAAARGARVALRQPVGAARFNSTSSSAGKKTLENAQESGKKALENAQETASKAFARAQELAGPLGDRVKSLGGPAASRVGNLLGAYREPVVYNLSVARELAKQVYIAENLAPPRSFSTVSEVYKNAFARARDPSFWRETMSNGSWAKIGIYALEAYTIFKIGEMIGRRKLVGYFKLEEHH